MTTRTSNNHTREREVEEDHEQQILQDGDICSISDLVDSETKSEENYHLDNIVSRTCTQNYKTKRCILMPVYTRRASYIWMLNMNHFIATTTAVERRFSAFQSRRLNTLHETDYQSID